MSDWRAGQGINGMKLILDMATNRRFIYLTFFSDLYSFLEKAAVTTIQYDDVFN